MIIQPGTKLLGNLVAEFCSQKGLGKPPARVKLYSREEYIEETGDDKSAARYSAAKDQIAVSPDIVSNISRILHELATITRPLATDQKNLTGNMMNTLRPMDISITPMRLKPGNLR
ncbi:hypothetical protein ES705_32851 [subsurface metagenome]